MSENTPPDKNEGNAPLLVPPSSPPAVTEDSVSNISSPSSVDVDRSYWPNLRTVVSTPQLVSLEPISSSVSSSLLSSSSITQIQSSSNTSTAVQKQSSSNLSAPSRSSVLAAAQPLFVMSRKGKEPTDFLQDYIDIHADPGITSSQFQAGDHICPFNRCNKCDHRLGTGCS